MVAEVITALPSTKEQLTLVSATYLQCQEDVTPSGTTSKAKEAPVLRLAEHLDGKVDAIVRLRGVSLDVGSMVILKIKPSGPTDPAAPKPHYGPLCIKSTTSNAVILK